MTRKYTVVAGDTLWGIAKHFYGNGNLYPVIAQANGIENPDIIRPGQVLIIPDATNYRTYTVVDGDTLWDIAKRFYGNGNLYPVIARANGIENPDIIRPGQVLVIPPAPVNATQS
ncbi:MAG TPA: LysM peptidoglycan-binding domain-containing protein [Amycolatopsis sp.]|uniref:LysM peptidoglycan-binding domain-containing protein n=1 Tax=Amycolatopsis sp. TaxID=37632 RepID=UPI002B47835D|nr:LysM peptidoglycan-binding domain-containing protein [Amycolatopsis sp.]HKS44191.1 LysM peptidoglycan-binding domain-containing protein [Amycolatopsis sp.]